MNINRKISPYNHSAGNNVQYIVIHSTGNTNDTAKNNADYFYRADRQASAHYFVDDNSIWQVVEENQGAWHCGDGRMKYGIGNHNSIGIEMCGTANGYISDKTINNTIELVRSLMNKYGLSADRVVRHYDASRKNCPSQFSSNNWARWWDFKNRLNGKSNSNSSRLNNNSTNSNNREVYFDMSKKFINGSTIEKIWSNNLHEIQTGYLDPHEECKCIGIHSSGHGIVMYTSTNGYDKIGFTTCHVKLCSDGIVRPID